MKSILARTILLLSASVLLAAKEKAPAIYSVPTPPLADFSGLEWLLGDWAGKIVPPWPQGEVRLNVSYALDKRFLVLREEIRLADTDTVPGLKESWMGILGPDRSPSSFEMRVYSSTGFITRYRVMVDGPAVTFNPEGGDQPPPGWLFRRSIIRSGPEELNETVQAAPPNKGFFDYFAVKLFHLRFQERSPNP
jgi:hypothetical protein